MIELIFTQCGVESKKVKFHHRGTKGKSKTAKGKNWNGQGYDPFTFHFCLFTFAFSLCVLSASVVEKFSTAADEVHDLDLIAVTHNGPGPIGASHDLVV